MTIETIEDYRLTRKKIDLLTRVLAGRVLVSISPADNDTQKHLRSRIAELQAAVDDFNARSEVTCA